MAADAPVGLALDEQKLPVGGCNALGRIGDLGGRIGESQFTEDERHQRPLGEAVDDLAGRVAEDAGLVLLCLVDGAAQVAWFVDGVGVGEQEPAAAGLAGCGPEGVVLSGPARFEFGGLEEGDAGEGAGDLGGAVGRVIVDDDQFPFTAKLEDVFRLCDQRLEALSEAGLLVAGGNDDGKLDEFGGFGLVKDGARLSHRPCPPVGVRHGLAGLIDEAEDRGVEGRISFWVFGHCQPAFRSGVGS